MFGNRLHPFVGDVGPGDAFIIGADDHRYAEADVVPQGVVGPGDPQDRAVARKVNLDGNAPVCQRVEEPERRAARLCRLGADHHSMSKGWAGSGCQTLSTVWENLEPRDDICADCFGLF